MVLLSFTESYSQTIHSEIKSDSSDFIFKFDQKGLSYLAKRNDKYPTNYVRANKAFGAFEIHYKNVSQTAWDTIRSSTAEHVQNQSKSGTSERFTYTYTAKAPEKLACQTTFNVNKHDIVYTLKLTNNGPEKIYIGSLAFPLDYNKISGEKPKQVFEETVMKHHIVAGDGSYVFWERATGVAPYLLMTPLTGTPFEFDGLGKDRGAGFSVYVHSAGDVNEQYKKWRLPRTGLYLAPGQTVTYGLKFQWAPSYQGIRDILYKENIPDINVVPGMTVPQDLPALISIRSKQKINSISAEFKSETEIVKKANSGDYEIYQVKFKRLGENMLTVNYGKGYKAYLEFFSTEALSTLYKKRAEFLVNSQQHRDSTKWYNGLFSQWDMRVAKLRGPDDPDVFVKNISYPLASDDPALDKAPFLAEMNVKYPDQKEIDAIEYYIKHFVWGGLQRTDQEKPYPYGVYGIPNWLVNRNADKRKMKATGAAVLDTSYKMRVWRSYDYPQIIMLYYHMYQIASLYPDKVHYLDKMGYLTRAKETAKAYFSYPYQILPWYEIYKWGCYNELLIVNLMETLKKEGFPDDAEALRKEWEKKVKYFIYDDPYPFRSEYSVDATAFESSHALAKYGVLNTMQPDTNLWYDKNLKKWYSHPKIDPGAAAKFMDRDIQANIALRGWLENTYYHKGSDFRSNSDHFVLTYMAQMGGWSIMDYALNFAKDPDEYLPLGYASYLSAFALMNTGTAKSNYGFWYPGKANDGATGWAFEPQIHNKNWINEEQDRGPWFYDGEIDLGYGGALRTAATVVTHDPVFGLIAYGGLVDKKAGQYMVDPKDGVQQRFWYVNNQHKFNIEIGQDGFSDQKDGITFNDALTYISVKVDNRTKNQHPNTLSIKGLAEGDYVLKFNGSEATKFHSAKDGTAEISFKNTSNSNYKLEIIKL
jgi:hypothetical protein